MRNGQNKRMRGRNNRNNNNNNNRGPNPLTRSYESMSPDNQKVRGNPQHVAEKYLQMARDAQSSGDPVAAESYLQHAEHYFRIILAAQEQYRQQNSLRQDQDDDETGEEEDDEPITGLDRRFESRPELYRNERQDQPRNTEHGGQNRFDRPNRFERPQQAQRPPVDLAGAEQPVVDLPAAMPGAEAETGERDDQPRGERPPRRERFDRRRDRFERGERPARAEAAPAGAEGDIGLPAFITGGAAAPAVAASPDAEHENAQFPLRRPRRRRFVAGEGGETAPEPASE